MKLKSLIILRFFDSRSDQKLFRLDSFFSSVDDDDTEITIKSFDVNSLCGAI